jgi:general secretion pathway protein G
MMRNSGLLVLALLLAVSSSGCTSRKAQASKTQADLNLIAQALTQYEADFNRFPSDLNALRGTVIGRDVEGGRHDFGPYVAAIPVDPWGHAYLYRAPARDGGLPALFSTGADGREGGGDDVHRAIKSIRSR